MLKVEYKKITGSISETFFKDTKINQETKETIIKNLVGMPITLDTENHKQVGEVVKVIPEKDIWIGKIY